MENIKEPGTYQVTLQPARWEHLGEKNGDVNRMQLVLQGVTADNKSITSYLAFTQTVIRSGQNAGLKLAEINAKQCVDLGMSQPFNPSQIDQLDGVECEFVCDLETYKGKDRMVVKWINGGSRDVLSPREAEKMWSNMMADAAPPPPPANQITVDPDDDLSFGDAPTTKPPFS